MPPLISCSSCGTTIPADAPAGMCPLCLMRLVFGETPRPEETPVSLAVGVPEPLFPLEAALRLTVPVAGEASAPTTRGGPPPPPPPNIRQLGNYELIEELGKGGMGVVYKAMQRGVNRVVAVKLLRGGAASDRSLRDRFQAEVQTLARLRHPNIVPVFEVGEQDGCPFFSMEYVPGGTLASRARASPFPPAESAAVIEKLALVVETVHRIGVLHRDIKPSNILLDADGTPRLTDFGLAKRLDRHDSLTNTDSVVGTPSYMAPEQASGSKELTPAADVYGLGATLYTLLTGHPPFLGQTAVETMHRVLNDEPPRPRAWRPDVPCDLEAVCLKCLEKDPARRYASARALADDLARWREGRSTLARPQRWPSRAWRWVRRNWKPLTVAAVIAVVAILPAIISRQPDPKGRLKHEWQKLEQAYLASMHRGEPFELLGPTGGPRVHEWVIGTGVTEARPELPFKMHVLENGWAQLLADPRTDRFRFSAEFKIERSTSQDSGGGIYFAHQAGTVGPDGAADRTILVRFREHVHSEDRAYGPGKDPAFPNKRADPVNVFDALVIRGKIAGAGGEPTSHFDPSPIGCLWITDSKSIVPLPWRKIVIEVRPESVRVWWRNLSGEMVPLQPESIPVKNFHKKTEVQFKRQQELLPNRPPERLEFNPRGGLGLYAQNAAVVFRNVILEPLP